jgi:tRNA(fMet)-specific endonuclease VapC
MALYMLDTNAVSAVMRGNTLMDERLLQLDPADWCISAVTHSEICYGLSLRPEATTLIRAADAFLAVATTLAWDATAAAAHGRLRAQLRLAGTPIGDFDEMIAAHAMSVGAVLVTGNERHFRRIPGLAVENWIRSTTG